MKPHTLLQKMVAEFIGTFLLVFAGCGAIMTFTSNPTGGGIVQIAFAFSMTVMAMIFAVGRVSGAHLNPAVSLAFGITRRMDWATVGIYMAVQVVAALVASFALSQLWPSGANPANLGTTALAPGVTVAGGFILEVIMTFTLVFTILMVTSGPKENGITAGIAIAGSLTLCILFGGPLTGASLNPARSIGPALVSGELELLWLFIAAPLAGGAIATGAYTLLVERDMQGNIVDDVEAAGEGN